MRLSPRDGPLEQSRIGRATAPMASCRELRQHILLVALLVGVFLAAIGNAHGSAATPALSNQGHLIGKVLSVRKVLCTAYFVSRFSQIHYYMLYFTVRVADQTYCSEYEIPVLVERKQC